MEASIITPLIISAIITFGGTVATTYLLVMYKVDENKKEIEKMNTRMNLIEDKYHSHNREIGELKTLLSTTNILVAQIHGKMFHEESRGR